MRTLLLAAAISLGAISVAAPAATAPATGPMGDWLVQSGAARVHIAACKADLTQLCGVIVWLRAPKTAGGLDILDDRNANPALRTRRVMGASMIWGLKPVEASKWAGGRIYDPDSGKTYDSRVELRSDGTLKVEGCVMMICQAQTWTRV